MINLVAVFYESGKGQSFDATMVKGAATVAEAAAKAGVRRLIHVSALGADANHSSDSTRCKALGEDATLRAFPKATIVRPGLLVGAEDTFFNRFSALPAVPLISGGKTRFQPVYVGDVADAISAIAADDQTAGRVYDIVGPGVYSFRALIDLMQSVTGSKAPQVHLPWGVAELIALASSTGAGGAAHHHRPDQALADGQRRRWQPARAGGAGRRPNADRDGAAVLPGALSQRRAIRGSLKALTARPLRSAGSPTRR